MKKKKLHTLFTDIVFIAPVLTAFCLIVIIPLVQGILFSFTDWNGISFKNFVGFTNYKKSLADSQFLASFLFTFKFALVGVFVINLTGFFLALLVTRKIHCTTFMRAVFYMPNLIGGLTLGFVWNFIFVEILPKFGELLGTTFFNGWLSDAVTGFWGLIILTTWQMSGYMMIIYIAALQNIPSELIEAAKIDGANGFQQLTHILLPLIVPAFTVCTFLTLSNTFKLYDQNLALTGGGPGDATQMIAMNIYRTAYLYEQNAVGQAKAIIFLLVILVITLTQVYITKKKEVQL